MKKKMKFGLLATSSLFFLGMATVPAQAADHYASCFTTGASGSVAINGWNAGGKNMPDVVLKVYDELSDGRHVRIRLIVSYMAGGTTYFPWHADYDGYGTYKEWDTSVTGGAQIGNAAVQVARYEGDDQLNYCTEWVYTS
ncbi:hypothetical protein OG585_22385 [Streptomyces sp. NBC_01340]|uniref:hypothetical protein n=1 Tax=unclassified Streptomyces TaxID=2593676 RepID=UPI00224CAF3E|nr:MULTISPECIES: hypothetical protein [unclassified Streptomyces]MCX4455358.1 hypothetical protein [Streptomyces sp. NBC_01719]MCX4494718.1 hypothetical protein [Streptomyces sp. NBC_01728]MCX4590719.1 hypothetical protein [Streptomyces sp. NBC_01549]WSI39745.1 hypothetical protein OG585_22385 [Streptomyces sp. NBC_01340]